MIIPMLCVTIFVILVVWFLLPRVARLMIHTPTAISIFVCLSMVQLMAVDRKSGSAGMPRPISYAVFCLKKKRRHRGVHPGDSADLVCSAGDAVARELSQSTNRHLARCVDTPRPRTLRGSA